MRRLLLILAGVALLGVLAFAVGVMNARADPVMRRATIALPRWPANARPIRVALLSDIHMESWSMTPARLLRIVGQVNAARPDLVVIAGDFVDGLGPTEARAAVPAMEPALARLRAPLGVVAVLGNHDHWTDPVPVEAMLRRLGAVTLRNGAARAGPLAAAGYDDQPSGHLKAWPTLKAWRRLKGAGVAVSHSPGAARWLPPGIGLLLAGHTHCGQVVLPIIGAPIPVGPKRYQCGVIRDPHRLVIVTAGLGTSNVPVRWGAPPDWWLLTLGPR